MQPNKSRQKKFYSESIQCPLSMLTLLQREFQKIAATKKQWRYNHLGGVHNPWGRSANIFDSWALLEVCQSKVLLDYISDFIGPDIILWDSRFFSLAEFVSAGDWIRESDFSPLEPMNGVTVRIPITTAGLSLEVLADNTLPTKLKPETTTQPLVIEPGCIACHDTRLPYRYESSDSNPGQYEYVIQYASGHSKFVRDQTSPIQRSLAERLPLINYGEAPIWLVRGQDHMNNNFVTGFAPAVAQWTKAAW